MLAALKFKNNILESFYLDKDDLTIRRKTDDLVKGKFKKNEVVVPYTLQGNNGFDYRGVWVPGSGTTISLPWVLTVLRGVDFSDGMVVDHRDGDITNNLRTNLRVITQQENSKNRKVRHDSTTGITGINFHKPSGKYTVRRTINGKRTSRSHETLEGAIEILKSLEAESLADGYTKRHCQCERSTTIESPVLDAQELVE